METYYVETYYGISLTNWIWFLAFSENFGVDIHLRTFGSFVWKWRLDIPSSLTTLVSGHQEINGIAKCLLFCDSVALMSRNTCWDIIYVYIIFTIIYIYIYKHMCIHIVVPHESHSANEFPWVLVSILPRSFAFQSWQAMVVAPFSIKSDLPKQPWCLLWYPLQCHRDLLNKYVVWFQVHRRLLFVLVDFRKQKRDTHGFLPSKSVYIYVCVSVPTWLFFL